MKALAHENPSHVCPPFAINRRMRIAFLVRKLVMNAVGRYPENWPAFKGERCANREEILDPLWSLVAAVRKQAVIAHADSQAAGNPPQEHGNEKCLPGKKEDCCDRADVERQHESGCDPVNL